MRQGVVADYDPYTIHNVTQDKITSMELHQLGEMCHKYGLSCDYTMNHGFEVGEKHGFEIKEFEHNVTITGRAEDAYAMVAASVNYEHNFNELASDRGPSRADQLENELECYKEKHQKIIDEISKKFKEESDTDLFYSRIWDKALNIVKDVLKANEDDC